MHQDQVQIFPNPSNGKLNLVYDQLKIKDLRLLDAMGRVVKVFPPQLKTLEVAELPSGIYYLSLSGDKDQVMKKIIIRNE